ncbi:MAG: 50S ribosomal protein L11 methyltransferase [bacterium]|nr:MAG: 50S ribosomal protein L11 methyltransferase [bacterium]
MSRGFWKRLTLRIPARLEEAVCDYLTTLTGRGVCCREEADESVIEIFLSPEGQQDHIPGIQRFLDDLAVMHSLKGALALESTDVPEEDWMSVFRSQHRAIRVSERMVIRPTWCAPVGPDDVVLDPGMAFGTGSHSSTMMCLLLLDEITATDPPRRMLDLGTGSGILAIAGAHLGAEEIWATDIDPVAVQVARRNARDNGMADRISVLEGSVDAVSGTFDLITANLSASLLKRLCGPISRRLAPGGSVIVSGIMVGEHREVLDAMTQCGLETVRTMRQDVWEAALLKRA